MSGTGMSLPEFAAWVLSDDPCRRCQHPRGHHFPAWPRDCHEGCDDTQHGCTCPGYIEEKQ